MDAPGRLGLEQSGSQEQDQPQSCGTCRFCKPEQIAEVSKGACCWGPPAMIAVPAPQGLLMKTVRPIVLLTDWGCYQYERAVTSAS